MLGRLASDSIEYAKIYLCGIASSLKPKHDSMIDEVTKNGDDTSWLSGMGGDVQVYDEDQSGFSKALK